MRSRAAVARAVDLVFAFLMHPRVRRVRRWSFLVTLPLAGLAIAVFGLGPTLGVVALRVALFALAAVVAWRLGGSRGEAVLDLLMHPRARRLQRVEARVWLAVPRLLLGAARGGFA